MLRTIQTLGTPTSPFQVAVSARVVAVAGRGVRDSHVHAFVWIADRDDSGMLKKRWRERDAIQYKEEKIKNCNRAAISVKARNGGAVRCEDKPKYIVSEDNTNLCPRAKRRTH